MPLLDKSCFEEDGKQESSLEIICEEPKILFSSDNFIDLKENYY